MNLSAPKDNAFNEFVNPDKMQKVVMSSPVAVGRKIIRLGRGCYVSKIDHTSAYKLIGVKFEHLFLHGFIWQGKIYIETSQIFGAKSSVPNYDRFHFCFAEIVKYHGAEYVVLYERQLDDFIIMGKTYDDCKAVTDIYLHFAEQINLPLASFEKKDKAFLNQQEGVILGIFFDTKNLSWSLPDCKFDKYMFEILSVLHEENATQKELQKVLGVINNVTQMSQSLKFFRDPIVLDLKRTYSELDNVPIPLSDDCKKFLNIWLHILKDLKHHFPLPTEEKYHPSSVLCFATDAAGGQGVKKNAALLVGIGAVGFVFPYQDDLSDMFYFGQVFWPGDFIVNVRDDVNRLFGNKTTLLETIGLFVPLYHNLSLVAGRPVLFLVDNVAVMWSYNKGRSRSDPYTSMFVFMLQLLATHFNIKIFVRHVRRCSTNAADLADKLTRTNPEGRELALKIRSEHTLHGQWPPSLLEWFRNPVIDWSLGAKLLHDFNAVLGYFFLIYSLFWTSLGFLGLFYDLYCYFL